MTETIRQLSELSRIERIAAMPEAERTAFIAGLSDEDITALELDWYFWARPSQLAPAGDWRTWVLRAGRGFGKALDISTPIPTRDGWSTMGALRVGDVVFDENGDQTKVVAVHPVMIGRPCYRVRFSDGSEVVADGDHLWATLTRHQRKAARRGRGIAHGVVTTKQVAASLYDGREVNHAIPLTRPLACDEASLHVDPYLLGCWIGDGSSKASEITTADDEIVSAFIAGGWRMTAREKANCGAAKLWAIGAMEDAVVRDGTTGRMLATENSWLAKMRMLGLYRNKHLPAQYLRASEPQRLALLQGLMDTDGYVSAGGHVEYCTTVKVLADGVHDLCVGLGFKAVVYEGRATLRGVDHGPKYRVCFTPYRQVFRLRRKAERIKAAGRQSSRQGLRYIVAVERVESRPVRCITVDSPSRLYLCGRAMIPTHNTRSGAEWVQERAMAAKRWMALIAKTPADARDVMIEGPSGLLRVGKPEHRPVYQPSIRRLTWPNGTWATIYSDEKPDQLRGFSGDTAWFDEFGKFRNPQDVWDNLQFGMREASVDRPRILITTTPRPIKVLREIERDPKTVKVTGSSYENRANLDPTWFEDTISRYEGTRLGRQEIHAELLDEVPGALWSLSKIDAYRVRSEQDIPDLQRVVVGLDPNTAEPTDENAGLAEAGIVVVGLGVDGNAYVLDDLSERLGPADWAARAISGIDRYEGDAIIAEINQGGAMVKATIHAVRTTVKVVEVHASRGKITRAEPFAALYEQGRVRHVGTHTTLEDQMTMMTPYGIVGGTTADRVDALVWALAALFPKMVRKAPPALGVKVEGMGGYNPQRA